MTRGLLDTSILIAREQGRPVGDLPSRVAISVITLGELEVGVLTAVDRDERARRADTLAFARAGSPVPVTESVMACFARLAHDCHSAGVRARPLDALIAATAVDQGLPLFTQDGDFRAIAAVHPALDVVGV